MVPKVSLTHPPTPPLFWATAYEKVILAPSLPFKAISPFTKAASEQII